MAEDRWFESLVEATEHTEQEAAPASLKSKVYSALVTSMAASGGLLDLRETRAAGGRLCVFETAVAALPTAAGVCATNPCRVCHARVLGERMEHAPIFWPGCPYSEYHNG